MSQDIESAVWANGRQAGSRTSKLDTNSWAMSDPGGNNSGGKLKSALSMWVVVSSGDSSRKGDTPLVKPIELF